MRTTTELRREIALALSEDRLEEAELLIEQLVPISAEQMDDILNSAPLEDESLGPEDLAAIAEARRLREAVAASGGTSSRRAS